MRENLPLQQHAIFGGKDSALRAAQIRGRQHFHGTFSTLTCGAHRELQLIPLNHSSAPECRRLAVTISSEARSAVFRVSSFDSSIDQGQHPPPPPATQSDQYVQGSVTMSRSLHTRCERHARLLLRYGSLRQAASPTGVFPAAAASICTPAGVTGRYMMRLSVTAH